MVTPYSSTVRGIIAPGLVGAAPDAAKRPPSLPYDASSQQMCDFGTAHGYWDGYEGRVRDHRLEIRLVDPTLINLFSSELQSMYGDCYVVAYNQGLADGAADRAAGVTVQNPSDSDPEPGTGTGTLTCDVINIQTALRRLGYDIDVDGDWGPETQAAYVSSGKTCAELVPSCKTCPTSAGTGGGGTTKPPVTPPVTPVVATDTTKKSSVLPWVLAGLGGVAVAVGAYYAMAPKPKPNPAPRSFAKWLETFVSEKGISKDTVLEVEGPSGTNWIPVGVLMDMMKQTSAREQGAIKNMIVRIDFVNGDVLDYFRHLAKAVAQ